MIDLKDQCMDLTDIRANANPPIQHLDFLPFLNYNFSYQSAVPTRGGRIERITQDRFLGNVE